MFEFDDVIILRSFSAYIQTSIINVRISLI